MNERTRTIKTYDESAVELAEYFKGVGSRVWDIKNAFSMVNRQPPRVVEIGCGDGRDAREILQRTPHYLGMDISTGMLNIAREHNPGAHLVWGDIATFEIPEDTDIVFSFASLLHSPPDEIRSFFARCYPNLSEGGIIYISLKLGQGSQVKTDRFGERLFYYYNPGEIGDLAWCDAAPSSNGNGRPDHHYLVDYLDYYQIGDTDWFRMALRKP